MRLIATAVVMAVLTVMATPGHAGTDVGDQIELALPIYDAPDDGNVQFDDIDQDWILVDLWATWCGPCVDSLPWYDELDARYDDLKILAVSIDRSTDAIAEFVDNHEVELMILHDSDQRLFSRLNPPAMPTAYLVDETGTVRHVHHGFTSDDRDKIEHQLRTRLRGDDR